ncbi:hypothetical protein WNY78_12825 [Psychroserpens sp. AS72]|uniref:hypothetical protein n=1 Tax=Psychroserpens sp. AS72 TaxID=3135775 RepID=UPI00317205D3
MVIISKYLVPRGYIGITIFPFIFLKYYNLKSSPVLMNHEKIHMRQQLELLVIPFYIFYTIEFVIRLIQYKKWYLAYQNISFEREAYYKEKDLNYLKSRPFWSFVSYL